MQDDIREMYNSALPSLRTGLFFNTYTYPTKISPESIATYIATHTKPGDTVLDAFSGSGATGLAALMCEHPTTKMLELAKTIGVDPEWGARNAVLYDISTYGSFASQTMVNAPDADEFINAANDVLFCCKNILPNIYRTRNTNGDHGVMRHAVWSSVLRCQQCAKEFTFYDGMVALSPLSISSHGRCPNCGAAVDTNTTPFVTEDIHDALLKRNVRRRKRIPVLMYGITDGEKWKRKLNAEDIGHIEDIERMDYPHFAPISEIKWGDLHRSGYHQGISHLHHFYTKRNFIVMSCLWNEASKYSGSLGDALKLWILSYNASHSTLMTRVVAKQRSKDLVLTGAQSGVLYVSNLPVEKNIFLGLARKIRPFARAFRYIENCSGHVLVHNSSSTKMLEADRSIDYTFIDPPFGDFIPYSEVNQINELWLDKQTDKSEEAIISNSQKKGVSEYSELLERSLSEIARVSKPDSLITLVFHSSKAEVWNGLEHAIKTAGLNVEATSFLDKVQQSFKQVVSPGSVRNDALMLLSKTKREWADAKADHPMAKDPKLAYSQYASGQLKAGAPIKLDASEAYALFSES